MAPEHKLSGREHFLRPITHKCWRTIPEDMCSAWPRYHLASVLKVEEGVLPASCVAYSFAPDTCVPVALLEDPLPTTSDLLQRVPFGLLHFTKEGRFELLHDNEQTDITAVHCDGEGLRGRVTRHVRPLLELKRRGVALLVPATNEVDTIIGLNANEGYELFLHGTSMHPLVAEKHVMPIGTVLHYLCDDAVRRPVMLTVPDEAPLQEGELPVRLAVDADNYEKRVVHVSVRRLRSAP